MESVVVLRVLQVLRVLVASASRATAELTEPLGNLLHLGVVVASDTRQRDKGPKHSGSIHFIAEKEHPLQPSEGSMGLSEKVE